MSIEYELPKERLNIAPLKTIQEHLSELSFLKYSTRARNLAYQLQLLDFIAELLTSYDIYGGVKNSLVRQVVIIVTNIAEYLLFASLRQFYGTDPDSSGFPDLVGQAKRNGLLDKKLAVELNKINDYRVKLHPSKQATELDVKFFDEEKMEFCRSVLHALISTLRDYFIQQAMQVETEARQCDAEVYHSTYFLNGEVCPYCGEFGC
jgi:hypothetical protein